MMDSQKRSRNERVFHFLTSLETMYTRFYVFYMEFLVKHYLIKNYTLMIWYYYYSNANLLLMDPFKKIVFSQSRLPTKLICD